MQVTIRSFANPRELQFDSYSCIGFPLNENWWDKEKKQFIPSKAFKKASRSKIPLDCCVNHSVQKITTCFNCCIYIIYERWVGGETKNVPQNIFRLWPPLFLPDLTAA